jgi:hypothetical protein
VVLAQGATTIDQDSQHRELLVIDHRPQAGHPSPDQGDRVRVGGVRLWADAASNGRDQLDPLGGRRDIRPVHQPGAAVSRIA